MSYGAPYTPPSVDFDDYAAVLRDRSDSDLKAANFVLWTLRHPRTMKTGRLLARIGLALRMPGTERALRATVFRQFCGGTTLEEAIERARLIDAHDIGTILDYAVEKTTSDAGLDAVAAEVANVLDMTATERAIDLVALKVTGVIRFGLLEKISAGEALSEAETRELERGKARLSHLAERAAIAGVSLFVDAEHSWVQPAIDDIVQNAMERFNLERTVVLTTVQMYLRRGYAYVEESIARARKHGYRFGVKLVRGAYLELENERAEELGYPTPMQPSKSATDTDYDRAITLCLENLDVVSLCAATHNADSTRHLIQEMGRLGIPKDHPDVSSAQLLGMFDRITVPLARHGYTVYKYVPYGSVRDALPYLMRRADENKSVAEQLGPELDAIRDEMRRRGMRPL